MARLIQVGNLPNSVDSDVLQRLFEEHGTVRSATINKHFETGCSTGVGFVEMASEKDGDAAIAALNQRMHGGEILSVCWCESNQRQVRAHQTTMFDPMNMTSDTVTGKKIDQP